MAISLGDLTKISLGVVKDKRLKQEYTEIARDGIYYSYDNGAMSIVQKQHDIPEGILKGSLAPTIEESFQLEERVPFSVFLQIIQFYHDVVRQNSTEASVLVYRNVNGVEIPQEFKDEFGDALMEVGNFVVLVPNQVNSHGHTQFANFNNNVDASVHTWCEQNLVGVLETHSHCNFGAFWSGEDDKHEKHSKLRTFMVIGKNTGDVSLKIRYSYNYNYFEDLDFHGLFTETGVVEEVKVTHNLITKGLDKIISFIKGNKPEEVTQRDLTWKEVIQSLDLDNEPVTYPKEDWFARIQKVTPSYYRKDTETPVIDESTYLDDDLMGEETDELDYEGHWDDDSDYYEDDWGSDDDSDSDEEYVSIQGNLFGGYGSYNKGKKKQKRKNSFGKRR